MIIINGKWLMINEGRLEISKNDFNCLIVTSPL